MQKIRVHDVEVAYRENGNGPTVIAAHCSSATHREWRQLADRLSPHFQVITPDLIGYGDSDRWPSGREWPVRGDADALTALAKLAPGPVHLVGHSYGAAMALEAACSLGDRVASVSLVEPVTFQLIRETHPAEWGEIEAVALGVRADYAAGRPGRAAARYMGFWIGRLRWWLMGRRGRAGVIDTVGKVAMEFGAIHDLDPDPSGYSGISAPTLLIAGSRTRRPALAVVERLGDLLPESSVRIIPDAGHMSPYTHRELVNGLIAEHIAAASGRWAP